MIIGISVHSDWTPDGRSDEDHICIHACNYNWSDLQQCCVTSAPPLFVMFGASEQAGWDLTSANMGHTMRKIQGRSKYYSEFSTDSKTTLFCADYGYLLLFTERWIYKKQQVNHFITVLKNGHDMTWSKPCEIYRKQLKIRAETNVPFIDR